MGLQLGEGVKHAYLVETVALERHRDLEAMAVEPFATSRVTAEAMGGVEMLADRYFVQQAATSTMRLTPLDPTSPAISEAVLSNFGCLQSGNISESGART